jgi:thiol:disulfide interchange protein DsbD
MLVCAGALADSLLPKKQPEFLPVDQAFEIQPLEVRHGKLHVEWRIAKGYYLYRERLKFTLEAPAGAALGAPALPRGEQHEDDYQGKTEVYRQTLAAELPLPQGKGPVKLAVGYQGCADAGLCYPPQTRTLELAR